VKRKMSPAPPNTQGVPVEMSSRLSPPGSTIANRKKAIPKRVTSVAAVKHDNRIKTKKSIKNFQSNSSRCHE
jgi:hypothetical protein